MKKKFLAVNVALALGAMSGVAGAVVETVTIPVPQVTVDNLGTTGNIAVTPGNVVAADNHIGTTNVVPYYSVQNGNTVALTITNNDQLNGKAVKVRFRGAAWSDDVLDFQVFLSPADVWTAAIVKNPTTGEAQISTHGATGDKTCTLPLDIVDQPFIADVRLAKSDIGGTLEGYVEIITTADIPPVVNSGFDVNNNDDDTQEWDGGVTTNQLYNIIKHGANGSAPKCRTETAAANALVDLKPDNYWINSRSAIGASVEANGLHLYSTTNVANQDNGNGGALYKPDSTHTYRQFGDDGGTAANTHASDDWLQFPTPGISTSVSIINVDSLKAYTLQATALKNATAFLEDGTLNRSLATEGTDDTQGVGAIKAYFQQRGEATDTVAWTGVGEFATADKIFGRDDASGDPVAVGLGGYAGVQLLQWDLPDLSTPTLARVAQIAYAAGNATSAVGVSTGAVAYAGGPAAAQRDLVASVLQAPGFAFDYVTEPLIYGSTDIVINQPLRRYYYWYDEVTTAGASFHREFVAPDGKFNIYGEINTPYEVLDGKTNNIALPTYFITGREEESYTPPTGGVGFSPAPVVPGAKAGLIGEVSIISINTPANTDSGALDAKLTVNHLPTPYANGWGWFPTTVTGNHATASKFVPYTDGNHGFGLAAHWLLKGGSNGGEPIGATAPAHSGHAHSLQLPFIAYTATNVYSPAIGQAYGTTIPVRKGAQIR
jgi:hypothetical protein